MRWLTSLFLLLNFLYLQAQEKSWQEAADAFLLTQIQLDEFFEGGDRMAELYRIVSLEIEQGNPDPYLKYLQMVWAGEYGKEPLSLQDAVGLFRDNPVSTAIFLLDYATSHEKRQSEDHAKLIIFIGTALELLKEAKLDSSQLYIYALRDYASALIHGSQLNERIETLQQALLLTEKDFGKKHRLYADILEDISQHYASIGNLELATEFSENSSNHKRNFLGVNLPYRGLFNQVAMDHLEDLEAIDHPDLIRMAWLFRHSQWLGYINVPNPYRKWLALELYNDWMGRDKTANKRNGLAELRILSSKGQLEMENEQYELAIQTMLEVEKRILNTTEWKSSERTFSYFNTLNMIGLAYYHLGNFTDASREFGKLNEEFLKAKGLWNEQVQVGHNLILSHYQNPDKKDFLTLLKPFVEKSNGIIIDYDWIERTTLYGDMFFELNDYRSAFTLYSDVYNVYWNLAFQSWEREKESFLETESYEMYGQENTLLNFGGEEAGMMLYSDSHKPTGEGYFQLLGKLAKASLMAEEYPKAIQYSSTYINEFYTPMEWAAMNFEFGPKADLYEIYRLKKNLFPVYEIFLEALMHDTISVPEIIIDNKKRSFAHLLDAKANLLYLYRHMQNVLESSTDTELKKTYEDFKQTQQLFAAQKSNPTDVGELESLKIKLDILRAKLSQKTALVSSPSEKFVFWQQVRANLKPFEAVVEIKRFVTLSTGEVVYTAYIIKPEYDYPQIVFLKNGEYLEGRGLLKYQNSIQTRLEDLTSYHDYWKPIQAHLESTQKVYFSPDGVYSRINLHTLLNPETGRYLLDDMTIHHVISSKELPNGGDFRKKVKSATLMGRPAYFINDFEKKSVFETIEEPPQRAMTHAQITAGTISDLPATEEEINTISRALRKKGVKVQSYLGANATEENFKGSKADVLHVATHGFWFKDSTHEPESDAMFNSGLLFAGVLNSEKKGMRTSNDGILTAYEAQGLNLEGTRLAVLSACETALGHVQVGEGVFGLQRALTIAGVEKIIMSLWKVDDQATRLLFESFYNYWLSGKYTLDKAFQLAQQEIKNIYEDPYYWGAFILVN
jgi:CHAT domain-containing protein